MDKKVKKDKTRRDQPIQRIARWVGQLLAKETRTMWEDQKIENYRLNLVAREQRLLVLANKNAMQTNRAALRRKTWQKLTRGAFANSRKPNPFVVSYAKQQASGH